jgi:hypothetical protein
MAKYQVEVVRTSYRYCTVTVEADSEDEAKSIAMDEAEEFGSERTADYDVNSIREIKDEEQSVDKGYLVVGIHPFLIKFKYFDGYTELHEEEREHIERLLNEGYVEGILNRYDSIKDEEVRGYWKKA